jgi:dihydroflavonol-4-reductase
VKRLMLTGATGFVGRNFLLKALREKKYDEIIVPVRSREKLLAQFLGDGFTELPSIVRPVVGAAPQWNLRDIGPVDHVVHSASENFGRTRQDFFRVNVEGTRSFLQALEGHPQIVLLSSQAAGGPCEPHHPTKVEGDEDHPVTLYGESKKEMERVALQEFGYLNLLLLRPVLVFGARDTASLPLFKMVRTPLHFKPGFRPKYFSFISVDDLVEAIFAALEKGGDWSRWAQRYFFVVWNEPITDRQILRTASSVSERAGMIVSVPQPILKVVSRVVDAVPFLRRAVPTLAYERAKEIWPDRWVVSSQAFEQHFQWKPKQDLRVTLQATHDWYFRTGQLRSSGLLRRLESLQLYS